MNDTITLTVAAEPKTPPCPTSSAAPAVAEKRLQDAGFAVRTTTEDTTDATQDGRVISTDPAAGQQANTGATITIVIGRATTGTTPESTTPYSARGADRRPAGAPRRLAIERAARRAALEPERAPDELLHDLVRARVDAVHARIGPVLADRVLGGVA